MKRAKVYRNLAQRQELLGLEPADLLLLCVVLWLMMTLKVGLFVTALALLILYSALRFAKRGKPAGYTLALLRYVLRPGRATLVATLPDREGRQHSFHPKEKHV